jgi:hypothetical protein
VILAKQVQPVKLVKLDLPVELVLLVELAQLVRLVQLVLLRIPVLLVQLEELDLRV